MDAVTKLVRESFSRQIGDWCRAHGVQYIGHVIEDNNAHTRTGAMMADIADYEAVCTGNFLPGTVAACYSFVDKLISSFSSTIAALSVAVIGYTTTLPQPNDPASTPILILTIVMTLGMPILGWLCTILAMKFYPLTAEKMVEVQTRAHEMREASGKAA